MPVTFNIGAVKANPPDSTKMTSFRLIFFFLEQKVGLYCRYWPATAEVGTKGQKKKKGLIHPFQMLIHMAGESI